MSNPLLNSFDLAPISKIKNSHFLPALIRKIDLLKTGRKKVLELWGTGKAKREFLYVDDMAAASIFVMNLDDETYKQETLPMLSHINVGSGLDCSIKELTETVARVVGYKGEIHWDTTKPDGTPRKLMDVSRLERLGWKAKTGLEEGLKQTYAWFLENQDRYRK